MQDSSGLAEQSSPRTLRRWKVLLVLGIVLATGPALIMVGTVIGMLQSLHTIETKRAPTPADLSEGVQISMLSSMVGFFAGALGALLIVLACIRLARNRIRELSGSSTP